jgi:hypothetical protein
MPETFAQFGEDSCTPTPFSGNLGQDTIGKRPMQTGFRGAT